MNERKVFLDGWYGEIIPLTFGRVRIILCRDCWPESYEDSW